MTEVRSWTITKTVFEQNMDKFYRCYVVGDVAVFQWGRIGAMGQFQVHAKGSTGLAHNAAMDKLDRKVTEGYRWVGGSPAIAEQRFHYNGPVPVTDKDSARHLAIAFNDHNRRANRPAPEVQEEPAGTLGKPLVEWAPMKADTLPERALAALSLAATDPAEAMTVYPTLREELTERESEVERIGSYLSTLEQLLANAMGGVT